jgi:hypothetical protein
VLLDPTEPSPNANAWRGNGYGFARHSDPSVDADNRPCRQPTLGALAFQMRALAELAPWRLALHSRESILVACELPSGPVGAAQSANDPLTNQPGCIMTSASPLPARWLPPQMDPKIETRIARDVQKNLSRLLGSYPKLARLPIAPLLSVRDLIRLEIALERFARSHRSARSKRLVEAARPILSVARTRMRMASARQRAVVGVADDPLGGKYPTPHSSAATSVPTS